MNSYVQLRVVRNQSDVTSIRKMQGQPVTYESMQNYVGVQRPLKQWVGQKICQKHGTQ